MSKRFVYVLKNAESPPRDYTGLSANALERYLTSGSGVAFATFRLVSFEKTEH